MKNNRREFLKLTGMAAGAGLVRTDHLGGLNDHRGPLAPPRFNMHNYGAPPLETVRIGFIGVGSRGSSHVRRFARVEGVEVKAVCDVVPERVAATIESIADLPHDPDAYTEGEEAWKELCERDDIDLVIIATPWDLHAPQAVYAMKHGKHAGVEVPAAQTIDECWELVETSERTRRHCMMLANSAYGDFNLLVLNMARHGFFGEIVHGEGAYIHDRVSSDSRWRRDPDNNGWFGFRPWRLDENVGRDGNLYPTHGLGSICQAMDLNYGDKMDYMVSVSSADFTLGPKMEELAAEDEYFEPYAGLKFRGNMNTSIIRTHRGRTIMLQHDVSTPRPNVRFNMISGTRAIAQQYPFPAKIATDHDGWLSPEEFSALEERYTPEITKRMGEEARRRGGHGGVDTMMAWRLIDCLRNGIPLDMNVYDAALWSCITPLSEWSVARNGSPVEVPDFTRGAWITNQPNMDIELKRGGTTELV